MSDHAEGDDPGQYVCVLKRIHLLLWSGMFQITDRDNSQDQDGLISLVSGEGPDFLDGAATPLAPTGASAFEEPEADAADLPEVPVEAQRAPIGAWALEEPAPPEGPVLKTELKT